MKWLTLKKAFILNWLHIVANACNDLSTKHRLDVVTFRDLSGSSLYSCAAECASYPVCSSFNFLKSGRSCQLNYGNHTLAPLGFLDDEDYWYGLIGNWENVSPCTRVGCSSREKCSVLRNGRTVCGKYSTCIEDILENVAVGKTARASSTWVESPSPNVVVDGNKDRHWHPGNSCFHVDTPDLDPWWQVDLHSNYIVFAVALTTRSDCCSERLHDFSLDVSHSDPVTNPDVELNLCFMYNEAVSVPEVNVTCDVPVFGRFLRVTGKKKINTRDLLQICEVEVFGL